MDRRPPVGKAGPVTDIAAAPVRRREPAVLLGIGVAALGVSAIGAKSLGTWFLEVLAAVIAAPILVLTYRRFPLTPLAYRLILAQSLILMIGGHGRTRRCPT